MATAFGTDDHPVKAAIEVDLGDLSVEAGADLPPLRLPLLVFHAVNR